MKNVKLKSKKRVEYSLNTYVDDLQSRFQTGKATEHSYRTFAQELIESSHEEIVALNEPRRVKCGAPDFIVLKKSVPLGYVETKDLGEDLNEVEKSEQLIRYRGALGNLILTNYLEFRWYVNGEHRRTVNIGKAWNKKIKVDEAEFQSLESLFSNFLEAEIPVLDSAIELAKRLAASAQTIKQLIMESFKVEEDDGWLNRWKKAFSDVLIANLKTDEFADMFAQTLTYGYFTARIHHTANAEFSRFAAAKILPRTNPFLRQLFAEFAGVNMPDEISWAVDELVEILKRTNIKRVLEDFSENEGREDPVVHFYETFLNSYNPKLREKRGVYYTPSPVVEYIVSSVDSILKKHFSRPEGLADEKTLILDPAVGTASFLFKVVDKIYGKYKKKRGEWDSYVSENLLQRLFGFEILMAPYAVAHLKLGLQLQDTGYKFTKNQRLGVFLTDTLEAAARKTQEMLFNWVSEEANAASAVKRDRPIMVVIGNPPYSGESENDGKWINDLMRGYDSITDTKTANYFECEGKDLKEFGDKNTKWVNDDYVKFIRFSQWRIENTGHGILAFVTNHGFLDNPTFRGVRESLLKAFDEIYVMDLHGNSDKKEVCPDGTKDENVFEIKRGVSISFLIRKEKNREKSNIGKVFRADLWGLQEAKYAYLRENTLDSTKWEEVQVSGPDYLFLVQDTKLREEFESAWKLTEIFKEHNVGVVTARDELCIHFDPESAFAVVRDFAKIDTESAREKYELGDDVNDWQVELAQKDVLNSNTNKKNIVPLLYRPFDIRYTYFTGNSKGFHCRPRGETMKHMVHRSNLALVATKQTKDKWGVWASNSIIGHKSFAAYDISSIFPLFLSSGDQMEFGQSDLNLNDEFLLDMEEATGLSFDAEAKEIDKSSFGPTDVFYYMLGLLHLPEYEVRYKEFLSRGFPIVLLPSSSKVFKDVSKIGRQIFGAIVLDSGPAKDISFPERGSNEIEKVTYDRTNSRIYINETQYFEGVSEDLFQSEIGGFQPVERWLKDRKGNKLGLEEIRTFKKIAQSILVISNCKMSLSQLAQEIGGFQKVFQKRKSKAKVSTKHVTRTSDIDKSNK